MDKPHIIYRDEFLVAIDKPVDLPVHRNSHMPHDAPYLTKWVGEYFNCSVYNVHRLDAKTSGIVVLAFTPEIAGKLTQQFERRQVKKLYTALVREVLGESGLFEKPVMNKKKGKLVAAKTSYRTLETFDTDISYKEFTNIRISLLELALETGRWHQLRQHLALERNDIIGDNQHGDRTLNHIIEERTGRKRLYLHAVSLEIVHPVTGVALSFDSELPAEFTQAISVCKV